MNTDLCRDDALEVVLNDQTKSPDFDSIVNHLSECTQCQQRLDDLAARPSWWNKTRRQLSHRVPDDHTDLPDADTLVSAQLDTTPVAALAEIRSFLEPPRHPEMLGRIGKYEIECEIGRGGMGIVLKGFDSELNRPVAVKLLAPHLASCGTARQRFVREARAAAAVVHENVVAIYGIETNGALPSIAMPFISGPSLQQHIRQHGALDAVDVVRIGIQIASGLAAAHDQGLVHRDIKPANIILENGINRVQITDFGLARAAHDADITRTGVIAGTPAFMSPEQALSETIDHRSDLFSLGSVLYYAATGRLPFRASTPIGVLQQVCSGTPIRPREENSQIPDRLEAVIEKLLAKDPAERFENASGLRQYLTEYLAHLQQPTKMDPPKKLATPFSRRRARKTWKRVTVGMGLPLAVLAWFLWPGWSQPMVDSIPPSQSDPLTDIHPSELSAAVASVTPMSEIDMEIEAVEHDMTSVEEMTVEASDAEHHVDTSEREIVQLTMETEKYVQSANGEIGVQRPVFATSEFHSVSAELQQLEQSSETQ